MRRRQYDTAIATVRAARRRQVAVALSLLAIVLNLVAGVAVSAQSSDGGLVEQAAQNGWTIICSGSGLRVVAADGETELPIKTGATHFSYCIFCLPLMHGDALAVAASELDRLSVSTDDFSYAALAETSHSATLAVEAWPRAPPPIEMT